VRVLAARQWRKGGFIVALLDYGDFVVTYETGVDAQLRFDAHIEVFGETGSLRVQYDTPYIRHFPTTLVSDRTVGDAYERSVSRPHLKDPYTHELEYFHETVTTGGTPKTSPEDYLEDMELFIELVRTMEKNS
jgi:predicted dehydrogenase